MSGSDSSSGFSNSGSNFDSESGDGGKSSDESNGSSASEEIKMITSNPKVQIDIENALKLIKADSTNHSNVDLINNDETIAPKTSIQIIADLQSKQTTKNSVTNVHMPVNEYGKQIEAQAGLGVQQKAKILRQQRKAEKQMAKQNSTEIASSPPVLNWKKVSKNTEKTLKSLIDEMPSDGKHKLKVCVL